MRRAYPNWKSIENGSNNGRGYAKVSDLATYRIVVANDKVASLTLQHVHQDCYE
ncbi:hypothetical protein AB0J74_15650 [Asanoa sp. NPDC049573]|uniref:hypothetical protein n=1 Tax=Asanoa sp. NPDC049573 TaxID=3155396 RepID=UPI00342DAA38